MNVNQIVTMVLLAVLFFGAFPDNSESIILSVTSDMDTSIQDMIDAAEEGDTVLVASGLYTGEGNRDLDFHGKDIVLLSEQGPEHTVIDCEELGRGFYLTSELSADAVISGFTIQNSEYADKGGCIYIDSSSPTIKNCLIIDGASQSGGPGIHLKWSSSIIDNCFISDCYSFLDSGAVYSGYGFNVFTNCIIQNNESDMHGAGLLCYYTTAIISDCIITENIVDSNGGDAQGGGIYSYESDIIVERCEISNNTCEGGWIAWVQGGGIYCEYGSIVISDCLISGNIAEYGGGFFLGSTDFFVIEGCDIVDNSTYFGGRGGGGKVEFGSSDDDIFSNCLISGNRSSFGGGLYCYYPMNFRISNCTIVENVAFEGGGIACLLYQNAVFSNCIIRDNSPNDFLLEEGAEAIVEWTNIEGGWPGEGNIDEDPLFVAPGYSDYRLLWGSPCIDSGNPDSLDLDGTVRDMGARSFDQSKELIVYLSPETREIAPGDSARVRYTVCNAHPNEKNFGTAAGVRLPDGAPWPGNPLEDPFFTSIAPSSNLTREFEYRVPLAWPEGTYSLAAGVGYDARIFDLDHFEFTVAEDTTSQR